MELTNSFTVPLALDDAWDVLLDLPRLATCLPGATLDEVEGDEHRGRVKVKVGPITAEYKGVASFKSIDREAGRAVLVASGRDSRGQGNASAEITADVESTGGETTVNLRTDLTVSGKVAQFGRGVLSEVSAKLLAQFADNLAATLESSTSEAGADGTGSVETAPSASAPTRPAPAAPAAVDLLDVAGASVLRRLAPVLATVVAFLVVRRLWRRGCGCRARG